MNKKKDDNMQMTPPIPQATDRRMVQGFVDLKLFEAVEKEMEKKNLKIREVLEWGCQAFLLKTNPKLAAQLGITKDE